MTHSVHFCHYSDASHTATSYILYYIINLQVFNNLLQYHYAGNTHLVYAIVRRRRQFETLAVLSLDTAVQQAAAAGTPRAAVGTVTQAAVTQAAVTPASVTELDLESAAIREASHSDILCTRMEYMF
jgi:Dyggve-Melchior-Clausen syndrome protein